MQITYLPIQGGIFSSRNVHMTNKSLHIYFPTYFNLSQHFLITKISNVIYHSTYVMKPISYWVFLITLGKSEGFDSCDRPSNFTQIGFKLTIFQPVRPWNLPDDVKNNGHLFYTTTSLVHHSKAIGEFKLELQSRNAKLVLNCQISTKSVRVWDQTRTDFAEIWHMSFFWHVIGE